MQSFEELNLIEPIQRAIDAAGYTVPTPIQAQSIPALLDGRDVLGCAQTGTGKTAAFALPVLQHLAEGQTGTGRQPIRALILSPTRELAAQIGDAFRVYGRHLKLRHMTIFGGVSQNPQVNDLRRGVDIVVATPGRLLDLMNQGHVDLRYVTHFVLDEADRMLDMGFLPDIRRVMKQLPDNRQNLLFSATMPPPIAKLANTFLTDPIRVDVSPPSSTVERIEQHVMFVSKSDKPKLLAHLLVNQEVDRAIVFTRTKHGANRLVERLDRDGISAEAIHGNKSQNARTKALRAFKDGKVLALVATDIASRGIDVEGVSHVFNFDLPNEPESYVHRIGRTGRAGKAGIAISFCDEPEAGYLRSIERLTGVEVERALDQPFHFNDAFEALSRPGGGSSNSRRPSKNNNRRRRPNGGGGGGGRPRGGGGGGGNSRGGGPPRTRRNSGGGGQRD